MTARDRAKMVKRIQRVFGDDWCISRDTITEFCKVVEREVDRAVKAERKCWTEDEVSRISERERIDQKLIDDMRAIGTSRAQKSFEYARRNHP